MLFLEVSDMSWNWHDLDAPFQNTRGKFTFFPTGRATTCNGVVAGAVSQNRNRASSLANSDTVSWQAPSTSGNYTFFAIVVVSFGEWYGQTNQIRASLSVVNSVTTTPQSTVATISSTSTSTNGVMETMSTEQEILTSTDRDTTRFDGTTSSSDHTTIVVSQKSTRSSITTAKTPIGTTAASSTTTISEPQNTQDVSSHSFKSFSYFTCLQIITMALVSMLL